MGVSLTDAQRRTLERERKRQAAFPPLQELPGGSVRALLVDSWDAAPSTPLIRLELRVVYINRNGGIDNEYSTVLVHSAVVDQAEARAKGRPR